MPCYHPLKGFVVGKTDNGKKSLIITPYDTECVYQSIGSENWEKHGHILDHDIFTGRIITEFVPIPCGQCSGCRLEYSRQWAMRCMLESEEYEENYFITLTYDDDNVPKSEYIDEDGVVSESLTLAKKDLQTFCKDLRSHLAYDKRGTFRFYACGEYGTQTARPHYHMIAFGLNLNDLKPYKDTPTGQYFTSKYLTDIWKKGHVIVGNVTFESCSYVSRYIMKKQKGAGTIVYDLFNIEPEFTNMSRKPGIGRSYFEQNFNDIYPNDNIVLIGGKVTRPPRYFDKLMDEIDEDLMNDIKLKRVDIAQSIQSYKDTLTTADYQMQLQHAENNLDARIKKLVRTLD